MVVNMKRGNPRSGKMRENGGWGWDTTGAYVNDVRRIGVLVVGGGGLFKFIGQIAGCLEL